jgi:hypothetical protein
MRAFTRILRVVVLALLPATAFAQGTLTGTVRDASGAILPGVTVEASSPALTEKVRSVVSDGAGVYRIIDLLPGTYSLTFTLPGFSTVRREGIQLGGTAVLTIPAELRVGGLQETITVTGETPVVDVQSVKRETVLSAEVIQAIPATRTVGSLLNATPGLTVDNNGLAPTPTMTFFSARGGQANEGRMTVNGMTVAAAFNGGGVSSYILDSVNVDEVSVVVSGGLGETDIGGPVMNLVPRGGGNDFRGQAFFNNAGDWSRGSNLDDRLRSVGITTPPGIIGSYDSSGSFGGPIKRDRVWFFGSVRKLDTTSSVEGIVANANAFDASRWDWAPDNSVAARQLQGRTMYIGRVTAQVTPKNRVSFNHEYQVRCEGAPLKVETSGCHSREAGWIAAGNATQSPEANTSYFDFPYYMTQATWTAPLTNRLLLEAGLTRFSYYHAGGPGQLPPDGIFDLVSVSEQSTAVNPATGIRFAPRANYAYRALATYNDNYGNPNNWRASAAYVTGSHSMKVGYQGSWLIARSKVVTPESLVQYRFNQGVPNAFTFRLPDWQLNDHTKTTAFYAQDTWTRGRVTVQGALRYDRAWSYSPAEGNGTTQTSIFNRSAIAFPETPGVSGYNDLTPRLGAAFDVFGDGRTAVKFNLGRYLDAATNDSIYTQNNPANRAIRTVQNRAWQDNDRDFTIDCDLTNLAAQGPATTGSIDNCGALSGDDLNFGRTAQNITQVDPSLLGGWGVRQSDWQWGVNVQQQVLPRLSVEVGYNRRWWSGPSASDGFITDDLSRGPADYEAFTLTAPTDPRLPGGGGYPMTFYTQTLAAGPRPASNFITKETNFGQLREYWQGVDFTANARLRNGLTLQVGTSTGRKILDRCDSVSRVDSPAPAGSVVAVPPAAAATALGAALFPAGSCLSREPFLTTLRGLASYTVPKIDVRVSGTFRSQPGDVQTAIWVVPNTAIQAALGRLPFGALATGTTSVSLLDNDGTRQYQSFRRNQVDMRVAKILRFGRARADVGLDLGNVLNTNYATAFDTTYQYSVGNTGQGGTWNNPTSVVTPRFVRINATVDF